MVPDAAAKMQLLKRLASTDTAVAVSFVNAHAMNSMVKDDRFFDALLAADVILRDGSGMNTLYRALEIPAGLNMNGTDFIPELLAEFRGRRVALWGTAEPYLERAATRCEQEFGVSVVSRMHGFNDPDTYVSVARQLDVDLFLLGMGMPKQEIIARQIRNVLPHAAVIVCGGAIIDFLAERFPRAPHWMRRLGLEWLFRLSREPGRLFKRYVVGNLAFMLRVSMFRKKRGYRNV